MELELTGGMPSKDGLCISVLMYVYDFIYSVVLFGVNSFFAIV